MGRSWFAGLASLSLLAQTVATPVAAAGTGVLVLPAEPDAATTGVASEIEAAGLVVRDLGPARAALEAAAEADERARQEALAALSAGLDAARGRYLEQDFDALIEQIGALRASTLWFTARPDGQPSLWELCFQLGLAHHARNGRGDAERAALEFGLAHALAPELRPPVDVYGPDVGQAFAAAIAAASGKARAPLAVTVAPVDARVVVDGVAVVAGSGGARAVVPGLHVVQLWAPGHEVHAEIVDTRRTRGVARTLAPLTGDAASALGPAWSAGLLRAGTVTADGLLRRLARERDASVVLIVGRGSPVEVVALDATGAAARATGATAALAARAALARLGPEGVIDTSSAVTVTGGARPSRTRWYVIGGVAATAAAIAVTGFLLSRDGGGGDDDGRIQIGVVP